jgi:hypothetical protein
VYRALWNALGIRVVYIDIFNEYALFNVCVGMGNLKAYVSKGL